MTPEELLEQCAKVGLGKVYGTAPECFTPNERGLNAIRATFAEFVRAMKLVRDKDGNVAVGKAIRTAQFLLAMTEGGDDERAHTGTVETVESG